MKLVLWPLALALIACGGAAQAGLEAALEEIDQACRERAADTAESTWPEIREGAKARGEELDDGHRRAHERILARRCEVAERIGLLEEVRGDLTEAEWDDFGGDALIEELREELESLRP